jgi:hypothetical protein
MGARAEHPDSNKKSDDEHRDAGLLRMLRMRPMSNQDLKLGKPRNPRQKPKAKKPG